MESSLRIRIDENLIPLTEGYSCQRLRDYPRLKYCRVISHKRSITHSGAFRTVLCSFLSRLYRPYLTHHPSIRPSTGHTSLPARHKTRLIIMYWIGYCLWPTRQARVPHVSCVVVLRNSRPEKRERDLVASLT